MRFPSPFFLLALASSCAPRPTSDASVPSDASVTPDAPLSPDVPAPPDASDAPPSCTLHPVAPTAPVRPEAGELFYAQLGLGGFKMGESALVIAPNGARVLIDVGNNSHADDIAAAVRNWTGDTAVDDVVITHFHSDHGDGLTPLLSLLTVRGHVIHRGRTDMTAAANEGTLQSVCEAAGTRAVELCTAPGAASCAPGTWGGARPATACDGLSTADLSWGPGAGLDFVAANGFVGSESFAQAVRPILMSDSNGENARSVTAVLSHGAFRMLVAGDLTGGGSDTDAVEGFYAPRIALDASDGLGVDVLHAGHHGRNTSSSVAWLDRWAPNDGLARNVVMGISTAHLGSPHAEVLRALGENDRLRDGRVWTTRVAASGATSASLENANGGTVVIATRERGAWYVVQTLSAQGAVLTSRAYRSVRACTP